MKTKRARGLLFFIVLAIFSGGLLLLKVPTKNVFVVSGTVSEITAPYRNQRDIILKEYRTRFLVSSPACSKILTENISTGELIEIFIPMEEKHEAKATILGVKKDGREVLSRNIVYKDLLFQRVILKSIFIISIFVIVIIIWSKRGRPGSGQINVRH